MAMEFRIADEVRQLGIRGAFAVIAGLDNRGYHPQFADFRRALVERLRSELKPGFADSDPVLRGFRDLHDAVKRSNRRFPSSAEALVDLFQRKGVLPEINPVVDVYNSVSLETRLSLGAHDLAAVRGDITLELTDGTERFVPLGASRPEPIGAGEYCYMDASGEVLCRLEVRQCERTKLTAATTDCFCIIQGNRTTTRSDLERALQRLVELTLRYCGGREQRAWIVAD
jgi:DNA/RNA-binding domain of Phe-tRNA-synthetase-like protein